MAMQTFVSQVAALTHLQLQGFVYQPLKGGIWEHVTDAPDGIEGTRWVVTAYPHVQRDGTVVVGYDFTCSVCEAHGEDECPWDECHGFLK